MPSGHADRLGFSSPAGVSANGVLSTGGSFDGLGVDEGEGAAAGGDLCVRVVENGRTAREELKGMRELSAEVR